MLLQQMIDADVMISGFKERKGSLKHCLCRLPVMKEKAVLKHENESGL